MNTNNNTNLIQSAQAAAENLSGALNHAFEPFPAVAKGMAAGNAIAQLIISLAVWLARGINTPFELLLRRRFGERALDESRLLAMAAVLTPGVMFFGFPERLAIGIFVITAVLIFLEGATNFWRDRKGIYWHSYFEGESKIRIPILDRWLLRNYFTWDFSKIVIEPVVIFGIAYGFTFLTPEFIKFSFFLFLGGFSTLFYQLYVYRVRRHELLNRKDAEILAEAQSQPIFSDKQTTVRDYKGIAVLPRYFDKQWVR